jgi:hypothetical protein
MLVTSDKRQLSSAVIVVNGERYSCYELKPDLRTALDGDRRAVAFGVAGNSLSIHPCTSLHIPPPVILAELRYFFF